MMRIAIALWAFVFCFPTAAQTFPLPGKPIREVGVKLDQ